MDGPSNVIGVCALRDLGRRVVSQQDQPLGSAGRIAHHANHTADLPAIGKNADGRANRKSKGMQKCLVGSCFVAARLTLSSGQNQLAAARRPNMAAPELTIPDSSQHVSCTP